MTGFIASLRVLAEASDARHRVVFGDRWGDVASMCLAPGERTGDRAGDAETIYLIVHGTAVVVLGGEEHHVEDGHLVIVPADASHVIVNVGPELLRVVAVRLVVPPLDLTAAKALPPEAFVG